MLRMEPRELERTLAALGELLQARRLRYELLVAGGGALLLRGFGVRPTKDLDVVALVEDGRYVSAKALPEPLRVAAREVASLGGLAPDWLNSGPTDLLELGLPDDFESRLERRRYGGLVVHVMGRFDQICFKLYATADQDLRSKHAADLRALAPTEKELLAAGRWACTHDPSPGFRSALLAALEAFGVRDAQAKL